MMDENETMIERVAAVFRRANESGSQFAYEDVARAAIEALRVPTEAMHEAGWRARDARANIGENATLTWQAMIDAALTPSAASR